MMIASGVPSTAWSWPCWVHIRIISSAQNWLPQTLKTILENGVFGSLPSPCSVRKKIPSHVFSSPASVALFLEKESHEASTALRNHFDFETFFEFMVTSAVLISEIHDPMNYASLPSQRKAFYAYVRKQRRTIPNVFYGYPDRTLETGNFPRWIDLQVDEARRRRKLFQQFKSIPHFSKWPREDYRSPLFIISALSFEKATTYVVRLWLYTWKNAHGAIRELPVPYRKGIFVLKKKKSSHTPWRGR